MIRTPEKHQKNPVARRRHWLSEAQPRVPVPSFSQINFCLQETQLWIELCSRICWLCQRSSDWKKPSLCKVSEDDGPLLWESQEQCEKPVEEPRWSCRPSSKHLFPQLCSCQGKTSERFHWFHSPGVSELFWDLGPQTPLFSFWNLYLKPSHSRP